MSLVRTSTTYRIETKHPTGYNDGTHEVRVHFSRLDGTRFVDGASFGCSRDYRVKTDVEAIRLLLSEHAMTLVKSRKLKTRSY